jgi:hypothetical protein
MTDLRAALIAYSRSFSAATVGPRDQSYVGSPLGAWLLLALVAPGNPAAAAALGLEAESAARLARELVDSDHGDYLAAFAAWSNDPLLKSWVQSLPRHDSGPVPTVAELHSWAEERTRGLIKQFPEAERMSSLPTVLASAVSAKTLWVKPFDRTPVSWGQEKVPGLQRLLQKAEQGGVASLSSGEFAFADIAGEDGGHVLLVIGEEEATPQTVLTATYDIADALDGGGEAQLQGRDDLPVGKGHSWSVDLGMQATTLVRTVPFELEAKLDLSGTPGFKELGEQGLSGVLASGTVPVDSVVQAAMARFNAKGFEAAAVTAMGLRSASMMTSYKRQLTLSFARPFAFLARDRDALPWFSGWIAEPGQEPADS